jgi:hypothetical protein
VIFALGASFAEGLLHEPVSGLKEVLRVRAVHVASVLLGSTLKNRGISGTPEIERWHTRRTQQVTCACRHPVNPAVPVQSGRNRSAMTKD